MGVAGQSRHAVDQVIERQNQLDALLDERDGLLALLDRVAALRGTADLIRQVIGSPTGFVADIDPPSDSAVIRWMAGTRTEALRDLVVPVGWGLGGLALKNRGPVRVNDYVTSPTITHHFDGPVGAEGLGGMLAVPIMDGARPLAVGYAALRDAGEFGDDSVSAMQRIAVQAATALRLAEQAEQRSRTAVTADRRKLQVSLHDSVGAMLFSIGAQVRDLAGVIDNNPAISARLRRLEADVSAASLALRESLHSLSQSSPDQALSAAVSEHCRSFEARTGLPARLVQLGSVPPLDTERSQVLIAGVREGLLNVEKHAQAGSVVVSIGEAEDGVQVAIVDDGAAPYERPTPAQDDAARRPVSSRLGIRALSDRAAAVGGRVSLVQDEDGGATLRVWVPALRRTT